MLSRSTATYLGRACKRGHADAQGQCTRYRSGGACVQCVSDFNNARREHFTIEPVDRRGAWGPDPKTLDRNARIVAELRELAARHDVSLAVLRKLLAAADLLHVQPEAHAHEPCEGSTTQYFNLRESEPEAEPEPEPEPEREPEPAGAPCTPSAPNNDAARVFADRWLAEQIAERGLGASSPSR